MKRVILSLVLGFSLVLCHAAISGAEFYISGYGGVSFNRDMDVREVSATNDLTFQGVDVQNGRLFGGKVGYWVGRYFGFQLDVYNFASELPAQTVPAKGTISGSAVTTATTSQMDVKTTAIAFNLLGRFPFVVPTEERGERLERRIEPYLGVGGGVFMSSAKIRASGFDATDTVGAFQALTGLNVFVTRNLSAFAEYKFSLTGEARFADLGVTDKFDLQSHHIAFGLSVHFR